MLQQSLETQFHLTVPIHKSFILSKEPTTSPTQNPTPVTEATTSTTEATTTATSKFDQYYYQGYALHSSI